MPFIATYLHMDSQAIIDAALEMVANSNTAGGKARLLGGIAVAVRCPSARPGRPLARSYGDIDLITPHQTAPILANALEQLGYQPATRFNLLHGRTRMMFYHANGLHVDVFVDKFVMCHELDLSLRLDGTDTTISLADLLLTKLQVAELNAKDVSDVSALLLDHELRTEPDGINAAVIADLLAHDWGWWRTVTASLRSVDGHAKHLDIPQGSRERIIDRTDELLQLIGATRKTLRWKLRAKAGERFAWREDPEETPVPAA